MLEIFLFNPDKVTTLNEGWQQAFKAFLGCVPKHDTKKSMLI